MTEKKNVPKLRFPGFTGEWVEKKLKEVSKIIDPHPSHRAPERKKNGIPFIGIGDVNEVGEINYQSARLVAEKIYDEHNKRYDLNIPSIGIGRVASLGKVIRLRNDIGKYAISPTMSIIQFNSDMILDYCYSYMTSSVFQKQFAAQSNGSTRQSVGIQHLRELKIKIPFYRMEQLKIGIFFANFDHLIALNQRKLDHLEQKKKGLLQKLFPGKGEHVPQWRFPGFTGEWEEKKLGDVVDVRSGKDYKQLSEGTIPVYGTGGYMLSVDKALSYNEDAIGIGRKGTIDKPFVLKAPFWTVDTLFYAVPRENIDLIYSYILFQKIDWKKKDESTGVPSLSKRVINNTSVMIARLEEQKAIGSYYATFDHLITLQRRKLDHLQTQKKALLQQLFV